MSAERDRIETFGQLENGLRQAGDWYLWGPYLSERQWGTVREDYSPGGAAWDYLPHDHARSRAYRWGEDGLAGFSDVEQRLCLSLALWNGRDSVLKERIFGLTGGQGNHGEDAKEYWWYLDALPSHAWNRWRYHYPQAAFPYTELTVENARRGKLDPEYELLDTGVFDEDRYWIVEADYAKGDPHDLLLTIRVTNAGPDTDTIHVLPTAWYRNTWSWGDDEPRPELRLDGAARLVTEHPFLGTLEIVADGVPDVLFCENETNSRRLFGTPSLTSTPKDGINDHVILGADTVATDGGAKAAFWYRLEVEPGETRAVRVRLRPTSSRTDPWEDFDETAARRAAEADEFYSELTPAEASPDEALVLRQALAGMLWSKQLYAYDVARWLDGDATQPTPPASRLGGRNSRWRTCAEHLRVRFRMHEAREAVAAPAAYALRERRARLVEHDPAGGVERVVAGGGEIVGELLDPRLVRDGGVGVGRARGRLGRILATRAVHVVQLLRERVVRLQLVVGDRPRGRDAVVVAELPEILLPQSVERRPVQLRRTADEVVHLRRERPPLGVVPRVGRDVAVVHEHRLR